jgi:hypothetical protein
MLDIVGRSAAVAKQQLSRVRTFTFAHAKVTRVEVIGDPARLRELEIAVL